MIPEVEAIHPSPNRPRCAVRIHWPAHPTPWLTIGQRREERSQRTGLPRDQCAKKAQWFVNNVAMCSAHAGAFVLRALEDDQELSRG